MGWLERRRRPQRPTAGEDPPRPVDPLVPTPLTDARIVAWLDEHRYAWFRDNDGDLGGLWRGRCFYFFRFGPAREVLQIRGHWNRDASIERLPELLEVCNAWNVDRIWPKAYARVADDGRVTVVAETATDLEPGVTDEQLAELLECGLTTASRLFDELEEQYPDPLASPA